MAQSKRSNPLQIKLEALDYHSASNIDIKNQMDLKALVVWLEDQKIRHYKIEDRTDLRENTGENWLTAFEKYCEDLECPFNISTQRTETMDWLITLALRCEYTDVAEQVPSLRAGLGKPSANPTPGSSPLDIDASDETLKKGVDALARILQVGTHPDPTVLLAACRMVIQERLTQEALKKAKENSPQTSGSNKYFMVTPKECGFDINDPVLAEAAKVLRLLHIHELRKLQTSINELIVEVQRLTADPKTDQSLGKVGR